MATPPRHLRSGPVARGGTLLLCSEIPLGVKFASSVLFAALARRTVYAKRIVFPIPYSRLFPVIRASASGLHDRKFLLGSRRRRAVQAPICSIKRMDVINKSCASEVFYNSRSARHPQALVFQRFPVHRPPSSSGTATSQDIATTAASTHNLAQHSRLQKVMMKSSVVVLSVAFLMLLGVACVVIANRTEPASDDKPAPGAFLNNAPRMVTGGSTNVGLATGLIAPNNKAPGEHQGVLGALFRNTKAPRGFSKDYVCTTDSCTKEGERLASLVDPALSPCDNFYDYTCATWAEEHPVPRGADRVSYRSSLVDYVEKRLDEIVRAELRKVLSMPLAFNFLSSHVKAILMRNACMEVERLNDRGLSPLREVLQTLHLPEWPTVKIEFDGSQIEDVAGALGSRLGLFPLASVDVVRDPERPDKFLIALDDPSREVFRRGAFLRNEREALEYESLVRKAFDKLGNPALSDLLGSAVLGLEDEISQALGPTMQPEDRVNLFGKMSVADLPTCSKFRWLKFLNRTMEKVRPVHRDNNVLVRNLPYLKKLVEILEGRQRRTIINYLGLKALLVFSPLLPTNTEGAIAGLYGRLLTGRAPQQLPRWRLCLRAAEDAMPFAFLSMYHNVFVKEHNVLQLRASLSKMKDLLGASLEDITWLSSRDTPKALDKLKRVDFVEFFPGWVMSEEERNVFYESLDDPSREVFRRGAFLRNEREALEYESLVRKAFDKLGNPALSDLLGSAVLGLEDEISQALGPTMQPEDRVNLFGKMSVADLPTCSKFRWLKFLNRTMEKVRPVHRDNNVLVRNLPYLKKLVEILEGRQRRTIINYLGLKALLVFSPLLPTNTEGAIAGLYGRLLTGRAPQQLPRWRLCLRAAEDAMPFAFLSMYHNVFVKEHNVLQLRASLSKMKDLLGASLEDITWLSSRDTPKALDKLKRVDFVEFFPGWVMSEEERNVFYESVRDVPVGNLLRSVMSAKTAHIDNRFRRLLYNPKHVGWFGSVFDVHVTYDPQNNTLYVPMAMFAEPMGFDSTETPLYIPRVLADMAHKLMGVVTGLGSLYDGNNGVGSWWTLGTADVYSNYSRCLSRQYNASLDFGKAAKHYSAKTVESNVRDNAALPFLQKMFTQHLRERGIKGNFMLPNLANVTKMQLFYIAFAMGFCENSNDGFVQTHIKTSTEALARHRVNIPLWNIDGFGDAFRCIKGSAMNPRQKCKFWRFQ
ncbi:neprilysin-1 [Ixodes scapularis]